MLRSEMEKMTRDEFYSSPQHALLLFLNNGAHKVLHDAQDLNLVLNLVKAEFGDIWGDKMCLTEQQIRLIIAECQILMNHTSKLQDLIQPKKWSDWENGPIKKEGL